MKKYRKKVLSYEKIADELKLSKMTVYNHLKKENTVATKLKKEMITPIMFVAIFAILLALSSFIANTYAEFHKEIAEEARDDWLTYYLEYMDNRENVDAKERAEHYHNKSTFHDVEAFNLNSLSGSYQVSIQSSILSLMLFLVVFSIPENKTRERSIINFLAISLLSIALAYYFITLFIFLVL